MPEDRQDRLVASAESLDVLRELIRRMSNELCLTYSDPLVEFREQDLELAQLLVQSIIELKMMRQWRNALLPHFPPRAS